jgi:serine/threonine protein kinase
MLLVPLADDRLCSLEGQVLGSSMYPGVTFRIERTLGVGGVSVAFLALRRAAEGSAPVVLKVIRPHVAQEMGRTADLVVRKEAVALGRLNERVPPTPFVVRLIEAGSVHVERPAPTPGIDLPFVAIEYVHGGAEGTTLEERVRHSVQKTGYAFDPERAAHAVACLGAGLDAVHEVGVIHRDVTPGNVLCCGFGDEEIFKLADFGIARPMSVQATFGGVVIGTPGYAAPEQILSDAPIGKATDVFGLGAIVFRLLTGEDLFPVASPFEGVVAARDAKRRSITESRQLCPELRARPTACAAIDAVIGRATAPDPQLRPPTGGSVAAMLLPVLRPDPVRARPLRRRVDSLAGAKAPTLAGGWLWSVRHRPAGARVVRSVAWDGDGRCLAATDRGLAFWNGTDWQSAPMHGLQPESARLVRRLAPGSWLVGGDGALLAEYTTDGIARTLRGADPSVSFDLASGDLADLAVIAGSRPARPPLLNALAGRHWLKPATLGRAAGVSAIARLGDEIWLVCGRTQDGEGFAAVYSPLLWEVERLAAPAARAYLGCAAQPDLGAGIVVGTDGQALRVRGAGSEPCPIAGGPPLTAAAVDVGGRAWAASTGRLWLLEPGATSWVPAWQDASWQVPIVSVFADVGLVIAMSADGGVVEGRSLERR